MLLQVWKIDSAHRYRCTLALHAHICYIWSLHIKVNVHLVYSIYNLIFVTFSLGFFNLQMSWFLCNWLAAEHFYGLALHILYCMHFTVFTVSYLSFFFKFADNAGVIVNPKGEMKGTALISLVEGYATFSSFFSL